MAKEHRFVISPVAILVVVGSLVLSADAGGGRGRPSQDAGAPAAFVWPEGKRAAVSLTFDDARPSQVDKGLAVLARYGIRATFYVSPDNLGQRLDGWKRAVKAGHEIGNHTMTHPCTGNYAFSKDNALEDYTLDRIAADIDEANAAIARDLSIRPTTFAYPCGQTFVGRGRALRSYVPLVAERFSSARGWLGEDANDPSVCDLEQLLATGSDGKRFDELRPLLDKAVKEGRWLILAGHETDAGGIQTTLLATLDKLCRYAADPANGIWVDSVGRIADYVASRRRPQARSAVDEILGRMTLEEKVGQMNMPCVYESGLGESLEEKTAAVRKFAEGTLVTGLGPGGGFFTLPNTILHKGPREQAEFLNELQRIALKKTRLGIPLLMTEEGTHGLMSTGATVFPEGPALGGTWDLDLISRVYAAAAEEARSIGIHQIFTLVVEPIRDPRLGRNEEAYGEDPYLCSRIAETVVKAVQGGGVAAADKVVAGLCHYPGQSQPASGLERGAMEVSERMLREVFLPPWEAGIKRAGALGVMATYPAIDGVPAHASSKLLTGILRGELGFEGLVLSEGGGIGTLVYEGLAKDQKDAGRQALEAGVDVGISFESGYMLDLVASVKEGLVPESLVDRAVRRILVQKMRLGLFENAFVEPDNAERTVHSVDHQDLALEAAREGIVLLKNEKGLLPLRKDIGSIAVIGPNADDRLNQLGDYVASRVSQEVTTILAGIRGIVSARTKVSYVKGCEVIGEAGAEIEKAKQAAASSEVAVVVVGENNWQKPEGLGTSGEGYDAATLELTGRQEELIRAVAETGTPTVVVLINGRPLAIRYVAERVPAILEAWACGEKGGRAVAEILFGDVNPSGKLTVTVPRHAGQLPAYYDAKKSKAYWIEQGWGKPYVDMDPKPLYPFGHGLSYTTFAYGNLRVSPAEIGRTGTATVSADITNTGKRAGAEVVELFVRDIVSSVSTPLLALKGFAKVRLAPGETKTVAFDLGPDALALYDRALERVVEPGEFEVLVGSSSADVRLKGKLVVQPVAESLERRSEARASTTSPSFWEISGKKDGVESAICRSRLDPAF